jgi:hypothetical protein
MRLYAGSGRCLKVNNARKHGSELPSSVRRTLRTKALIWSSIGIMTLLTASDTYSGGYAHQDVHSDNRVYPKWFPGKKIVFSAACRPFCGRGSATAQDRRTRRQPGRSGLGTKWRACVDEDNQHVPRRTRPGSARRPTVRAGGRCDGELTVRTVTVILVACTALIAAGCGGGKRSATPPPPPAKVEFGAEELPLKVRDQLLSLSVAPIGCSDARCHESRPTDKISSVATYPLSSGGSLRSGRVGSLLVYRTRSGRSCVAVVEIANGETNHNPLSCVSNLDCTSLCFAVVPVHDDSSPTLDQLVGGLTRSDAEAVRLTASDGIAQEYGLGPGFGPGGLRIFLAPTTSFPRAVEILRDSEVIASWGASS